MYKVRLTEEIKGGEPVHALGRYFKNGASALTMLAVLAGASFSTSALAAEADVIIDEGQKEEEQKTRAQEEEERVTRAKEKLGLLPHFPRIEGEIVIELQNDWQYDSNDTANQFNNLYTTTEGDFNLYPFRELEGLFLNLHLTLEQTNEFSGSGDKFFEQQGAFVENLSLNYEAEWWSVIGGKYGPNFSIAYDAAPGIYGTDLAEEDIEIAEKWGFGGSVTYSNETYGAHSLSASLFTADKTFLSESIINNRGRLQTSDGGPTNTNSLSSAVVAVDGAGFAFAPGLSYQIGGAFLDTQRVVDEETEEILPSSETDMEYRFVAAAQYEIGITDDIAVTPLVEYVHFWNGGGVKDEDRDYLTATTLITYQNWNLAFGTTQKWVEPPGGGSSNDNQWQVSAGYEFDFGLTLDVGWKYLTEEGIDSRTLGALATYTLEF
jgi:hypothetical protein